MSTPFVHGGTVDDQTRCVHHHTTLDVVAIKFRCCGDFYPCYRCHNEATDHPIEVWPAGSGDEPALLCGVCRRTIPIATYLTGEDACPHCAAAFNPRCAAHAELYFAAALV